jgi:predicted nucleic acid-binding protein
MVIIDTSPLRRKRVYLESSVISYLTARPSNDIRKQAKQGFTHEWWAKRDKYDLFVSTLVRDEIGRGNPEAALLRLEAVTEIPTLEEPSNIKEIVDALIDSNTVPEKSRDDAYHIALATIHEMEYILTWNQSHLANPQKRESIETILRRFGLVPPVILTPEQLLEIESCLNQETP